MAIADIFGPTPEELEYQRGQERENRARQEYLAKLPNYGSELGMYAGVARAGLETGEKLRGLRLFGESPSPEMERASVMKQILKTYQGQDMSNPDVLAKMSQELGQSGYPREAMQLMDQAKATVATRMKAEQAAEQAKFDRSKEVLGMEKTQADIDKIRKDAEKEGKGDKLTKPIFEDLEEKGNQANETTDLFTTFEENFGGYAFDVVGDWAVMAAKKFPTTEEQKRLGDWWMRYQKQVNAVRNKLFGSALTQTEKEEFLKAMVTPGMDGETIKRNLKRQAEAARKAYQKSTANYKKQGWNTVGFDEYLVGSSFEGESTSAEEFEIISIE